MYFARKFGPSLTWEGLYMRPKKQIWPQMPSTSLHCCCGHAWRWVKCMVGVASERVHDTSEGRMPFPWGGQHLDQWWGVTHKEVKGNQRSGQAWTTRSSNATSHLFQRQQSRLNFLKWNCFLLLIAKLLVPQNLSNEKLSQGMRPYKGVRLTIFCTWFCKMWWKESLHNHQ